MKKILLISLITILAVGLVGCNSKDVEVDNSNNVIESGNNDSENSNTNDTDNNLEEDKELENNEVQSGEIENGYDNENIANQPETEPEDKNENNNASNNGDASESNNNDSSENEANNNEFNNNGSSENEANSDESNNEANDNVTDNNDLGNDEVSTNELEGKLNSLAEKAEILVRAPMTVEITSETASTYIGLTEELFNENVASAMAYESMMMPSNFSLCLIELKDTADVANIKKQVIDNCDPNKWICMGADKCLVADSGNYIMLVMSTDEDCTALQNAFASEFGNLGEVLTK